MSAFQPPKRRARVVYRSKFRHIRLWWLGTVGVNYAGIPSNSEEAPHE